MNFKHIRRLVAVRFLGVYSVHSAHFAFSFASDVRYRGESTLSAPHFSKGMPAFGSGNCSETVAE